MSGRQVRSSSAVCNRGLCFQSEAWRRLDLHVAVLKQASAGVWEAGTGALGDAPLPSPLDDQLHCWLSSSFSLCGLQVHRQSEREFVSILHAIRDGSASRQQLDRLWQLCRCAAWWCFLVVLYIRLAQKSQKSHLTFASCGYVLGPRAYLNSSSAHLLTPLPGSAVCSS